MIIRDDIPLGSTYDSKGKQLTYKDSDEYWEERTYDSNGKQLTYKDSDGFWWEKTYDSNGKQLTFKGSDGFWWEKTYDSNGKQLTYKDSSGLWEERTYDSNGKQLTYKDSTGKDQVAIAFDPKYILSYDKNQGHFEAGCRYFESKEAALKHWNRDDERAVLFTKAILELP